MAQILFVVGRLGRRRDGSHICSDARCEHSFTRLSPSDPAVLAGTTPALAFLVMISALRPAAKAATISTAGALRE